MQRYTRLFLAAACLLTLALYWPALHGPFVFDDLPNLAALSKYPGTHGWQAIAKYLSEARGFPGRPLAMLSFYPQRTGWPENSFPFKLTNTLLHLACGWLLATWLDLVSRANMTRNKALLTASITSALWLIHPIQLSTVMLVIQRMTILATAFMLLGLILYTFAITAAQRSQAQRLAAMLTAILLCAPLALLCKETGALFPLYALILDSTLLRESRKQLPRPLKIMRAILVVIPAWVLLGGMIALLPWLTHGYVLRDFSLPQRLLTETRVVDSYLLKIALPQFGPYGLYNDDYPISSGLLHPAATLFSTILLIAAIATAWLKRRQWPLFAFAVFWYLGGQWLESTAISLELYFEHRTYLPMVGPLYAIVTALFQIKNPVRRRQGQLALAVWAFACILATSLSARVWGQESVLAQVWANHHPDSERATEFLASIQLNHGNLAGAMTTMQSISLQRPGNAGVLAHQIYLQCLAGTLQEASIRQLQKLYATGPYQRESYDIVGSLRELAHQNRCPQAMNSDHWRGLVTALLQNPRLAVDPATEGYLHYQLHLAAVDKGDLNQAIAELQETWRLDPDPEIPRLEAKYLASAGLYPQAIQALQQANASRLPLLRRLLVNDRAIWDADIQSIIHMQAAARQR